MPKFLKEESEDANIHSDVEFIDGWDTTIVTYEGGCTLIHNGSSGVEISGVDFDEVINEYLLHMNIYRMTHYVINTKTDEEIDYLCKYN